MLDPGEFYILASREAVSIPPEWAARIEALAPDADNQHAAHQGVGRNVYAVRATLQSSIERTFAGQHLLNRYQVRGAFANYYKGLVSDFKSIAASGWAWPILSLAGLTEAAPVEGVATIAALLKSSTSAYQALLAERMSARSLAVNPSSLVT